MNKKSGILVINLPSTGCTYYTATHSREKEIVHPENKNWTSIDTRSEYERRYPYLPARIIDNLLKPEAKISVVNWDELNIEKLSFLIHATFEDKGNCEYDLSRTMKRNNS